MKQTSKTIRKWNSDWYFLKTSLGTTWDEMRALEPAFCAVEVPHDWLIENTEDLYEDGYGWYRKKFKVDVPEGGSVFVRFDGVYMDCTVYVNGQAVGDWKYGYSTFAFDITDYLNGDENEMIVLVRHQSPNTRWYSGAGIYRNVWLQVTGNQYLPFDGTYVSTKVCEEAGIAPYSDPAGMDFQMELETEVAGAVDAQTVCVYSLWNQGQKVQELGRVTGAEIAKGKAVLRAIVERPALWSMEEPNCYDLLVELYQKDILLDNQQYTVGFRTMEFDPARGFFLNGKQVKVHGVCEHHDLGCLGAAFYEDALRRQFTILKEMGVNGLRTSHNMPDPMFMELADRMGFVVMSEAFDMWERAKTTYDYARFFIDWAERDVHSWVRRDRNHPSLMLWSIGNEIYDTHADAHGEEITHRLVSFVRAVDPKANAPITIGSNYMPWEGAQNCADIVKYAGYNYSEKYYAAHHEKHPDWIIYGSETASVVHSRGIYHFPLKQSILSDEDEQCSALGNSSTSWGADSVEKCITDDRDADFAFGQFLWTGFDYIGEPTPYQTKNSYFGQIDTAGFPKDSYYIFQSAWTDYREKPMIHIFPYWDFNPGQLIDVRVATNAPKVELFFNGTSLGVQEIDHEKGLKLTGDWQLPYAEGILEAVAYDETGKVIAREQKTSFGDSKKLRLTVDRDVIAAGGRGLCFVTIEALDEAGHVVENAVDRVMVSLQGPGRLLGMDNGDSTDYEQYKCACRKLFSGKLLAVIGSTYEAGEITVTVSGEGLESASAVICSKEFAAEKETDAAAQEAEADAEPQMVLADWAEVKEAQANRAEKESSAEHTDFSTNHAAISVRKVTLIEESSHLLSKDLPEVIIRAVVSPADASGYELVWKAVNDVGIEVPMAVLLPLESAGNVHTVKLAAKGDGDFRVRCMVKDAKGKVSIISQMEYQIQGLGKSFLNPYELITGGLYTDSFGEVGNGNEKGFSTSREGDSGVFFENVDFGSFGSDLLTIPVFALDDHEYRIDVLLREEKTGQVQVIDTLHYRKPSIWNHYQEETWRLPKRIKGVQTIGFAMHEQKVHIKGFVFEKQEKAYSRLWGAEASRLYGDSFKICDMQVEEIGNNVTFEFDEMDFGTEGAVKMVICGKTDLPVNTIHVRFYPADGSEMQSNILEFAKCADYKEQEFAIEKLTGSGRLDLIFLPGSQFALSYFQIYR